VCRHLRAALSGALMWLTIVVIIALCGYISFLFERGRYFYLHSFFIIPLYPVIFFIDHNGHFLLPGLEADSVHYLAKLAPLYLNTLYLAVKFQPKRRQRLSFTSVVVNLFLLYNFALAVVYAFYHSSLLPLLYVSYSVPLFAIFFNSGNFAAEVTDIRNSTAPDRRVLQVYFVAFIFIYAASVYYSITSAVTSSLLDSRGVGSIFASTSALIYCFMYAPLLSVIIHRRWPHFVTLLMGVTSLSKTALLVLPAYGVLAYRRLKANMVKTLAIFLAVVALAIAFAPALLPPELVEEWEIKFALDSGETLLSKAYMTRLELYADALKAIGDFPFGIGVGNFERYSHDSYRDAHNFVLTILAESGVLIGSLLVLAVLGGLLRTVIEIFRGVFDFNHFSFISVFLVYFFAGGVLQTTGTSDLSPIYYTPFYGVALFQLLNLSGRIKLAASVQAGEPSEGAAIISGRRGAVP
jgi:hypothetical protein